MTAELLVSIAAILISLAGSYLPGFAPWYGGLVGDMKRLVMLGLLVLIVVVTFSLNCFGFGADIGIVVACSQAGAIMLLKLFITAIIANQAAFAMTPASKSRS
jgi:hypothetical protein